MSGHSKWSKVKHQKAGTDAVKSTAFTKAARAITVAVRQGGDIADPEKNFRLRLAIEKARDVNMPKENIDRAIERALTGNGKEFTQVEYEGYGPGGVGLIVEAATDNHVRTVANIKHIFDRHGGSLATPGAVNFLFTRKGVLIIARSTGVSYGHLLEVSIDLGADDVVSREDAFEIYTSPSLLAAVKHGMLVSGMGIDNTEFIMKPHTPVPVSDEVRNQIGTLVGELEALDDVQKVYTTIDE